jgi:hypothetical protein
MIRLVRQYLAKRKLDKLVRQRLQSFEHQDFLRRRAAALKGRAIT